jgi:hypothetical protein
MAVGSGWLLPALTVLAGCAALHNAAPPVPTVADAPLPDSHFTQEPLPGVRGSAAAESVTTDIDAVGSGSVE